jgi:hypothetical protein
VHTILRRAGDGEERALLRGVLSVPLADRIAEQGVRSRNAGAIGTALVEREARVVARCRGGGGLRERRRCRRDCERDADDEARAPPQRGA